ncbi:MAG: toxin [Xanthomonadales bacterium]|nr:toxin [Xanthomonadales bacterium]
MSPSGSAPLVVNSWTLFAHPLFLDQLDVLIRKVESLRRKDPATYRQKNATKRLAAIRKLIFEVIPQDPGRAEFRQGKALGEQHTHWFRAKFFQQYRLFFRYHASSKIIVYAWVNDASTLRAYESKSDAYRVFRRMLDSGNPPDDWETLLVEAERAKERFRRGS